VVAGVFDESRLFKYPTEAVMKLAFFLKDKLSRQKSLKEYAWYLWY
jgi:hypothetical protein